jgi:hypothetical protein
MSLLFLNFVFGMVHGQPYEGFQKIPIYQFQSIVTKICVEMFYNQLL